MTDEHTAEVAEPYPAAAAEAQTIAGYATGTHAELADAWGRPKHVYVERVEPVDGCIPAAVAQAAKRA